MPAGRAGEESRDLLESTDIAYVLNDATAHEKLKEDQFQIRVKYFYFVLSIVVLGELQYAKGRRMRRGLRGRSLDGKRMADPGYCDWRRTFCTVRWNYRLHVLHEKTIRGNSSSKISLSIIFKRKLQSERAMKYDMDDLSSKDAYNESTAYKASGDQHKNQLVGQEGMINIVSFAFR